MKNTQKAYRTPFIEVATLTSEDILMTSNAERFDNDGVDKIWDLEDFI